MRLPLPALACSALLLLGSIAPTHAAGWTDATGKPAPEREDMRSAGDFLARLSLTGDDAALRKEWAEATATPQLPTIDRVAVGAPVTTVLVFNGCSPGPAGRCDVFAEFSIVAPDGLRTRLGAGSLWYAAPLTPRFMLGSASVTLLFREKDKGQAFRMIATVEDRVARKTLELSTPLRVD